MSEVRVPDRLPPEAGCPPPYPYLSRDQFIGPTVRSVGPLDHQPAEGFFPRFVTSILRQQISMAAAEAILDRLKAAHELEPAAIAATDPESLTDIGLSRRKAETVVRIATTFEQRGWSRASFAGAADEEILRELTSIRGVGPWTAKMQLMFALGRPDVFPVEDLGIRHGMTELTEDELSRPEMCALARRWRPYRTIASMYLWRSEDG